MTFTIDLASAGKTIISVIFVLAGLVFLAFVLRKLKGLFSARNFDATDRETMRRRWREIEQMSAAPGEMSRKLAVMEADKLLDYALKAMAMSGETLGERLKFAAYKYPRLRDVWGAHRVRNQLAHEATYHLDAGTAKRAIREFKKALEILGAI